MQKLTLKNIGPKEQNWLSIGSVSKMFDVSNNTLRYFDKEGIVNAKRADNNYRYYDDWDINFLIEYKKYRSYGFNLKEAKDILNYDSLEMLSSRIENKKESIRKELEFRRRVMLKYEEMSDRLSNIHNHIGVFKETNMIEASYFTMRYNNTYLQDPKVNALFSDWSEKMPLVEPGVLMDGPGDNYECVMSIEKRWGEGLVLKKNDLVRETAASSALYTVLLAGGKNTFTTHLLTPAFSFMRENNYIKNGNILGYYLARVHEGSAYKRYIEIWIPVKKI